MTDIVSQIAAFIRAQLDEDERIAKGCLDVNVRAAMIRGGQPPRWEYQEGQVRSAPVPSAHITRTPILRVGHTWPAEGTHIARHDPARVLRRVGGMREILDDYDKAVRELDHALMRARAHARVGVPDDIQATLTRQQVRLVALQEVVLRLSLEYFDHDGYLDEWKQFTGPLMR